MDADEEALLGRRRKRLWLAVAISLPFLLIMGGGVAYFLGARGRAQDTALIEEVTGAAFGCVAAIRGDAPEAWGLARALEHMSRMERITRDLQDPTLREEQRRFAELAQDAAQGCRELGRLMRRARRDAPHLYFAVPAKLAQAPDLEQPERWYRRVLPGSREEALELTRQIRAMADAINARRTEHELMRHELPVEGRGPSQLARIVELTPLPRDRERVRGSAWPLTDRALVLRRAAIPQVPCETRFLNRASCYAEFVQSVSWEGEVFEMRELTRPARVKYWSAFTPTPDGALWAVGLDQRNRGIVGRYAPDATTPELGGVAARVDGATNINTVAGGVAIFPTDGSAWLAREGMSFERVEQTPPPVVVEARGPEVSRGIELAGFGQLSIFGSEEAGWTSRLVPPEGNDVLLRIIDSHRQVQEVVSLSALPSGKTVALLQRVTDGPDAVILSTTFGRTWLTSPPAE